jgi:hypothetical protein
MRLLDGSVKTPGVSKAAMITAIAVEGIKAKADLLFSVEPIINSSVQNVIWVCI